jgi:hypothetical protein
MTGQHPCRRQQRGAATGADSSMGGFFNEHGCPFRTGGQTWALGASEPTRGPIDPRSVWFAHASVVGRQKSLLGEGLMGEAKCERLTQVLVEPGGL